MRDPGPPGPRGGWVSSEKKGDESLFSMKSKSASRTGHVEGRLGGKNKKTIQEDF